MVEKTGKESLWEFAFALYRSPGVEETALALQDEHGVKVNLLLWACWLEYRKSHLTQRVLAKAQAAINDWDTLVVQPLRRVRRELKAPAWQDPVSGQLRKQIKEAELLAERKCLMLLEAVEVEVSTRVPPLGENPATYLRHLGVRADLSALTTAMKRLGTES